jgi:hypothetical protein
VRHDSLPLVEAAKLLLDEWKFRQAHVWRIFNLSSLAIVTLVIAPYAARDVLQDFPFWISIILPALGVVLSVFAGLLFRAEYLRLAKVRDSYNDTLGHFKPRRVRGMRVGTMILVWFVLLAVSSGFTIWFNTRILHWGK